MFVHYCSVCVVLRCVGCWLLVVADCWLLVACWSLRVECRLLAFGCLVVDSCSLRARRGLLHVAS